MIHYTLKLKYPCGNELDAEFYLEDKTPRVARLDRVPDDMSEKQISIVRYKFRHKQPLNFSIKQTILKNHDKWKRSY